MLAKFGMYSSDDEDESRVTNNKNNRELNKEKKRRSSKCAKNGEDVKEMTDLTIADIVKGEKYAVLCRYDGASDSSGEDYGGDESTDDDIPLSEVGKRGKRHRGKTSTPPHDAIVSWIIVEVVDVLENEEDVRAKVYKESGKNWYPCKDDTKSGKKQPVLVEKFPVESFLCLVSFLKSKKHQLDHQSSTLIAAFMQRLHGTDSDADLEEFGVRQIIDHRVCVGGGFVEYKVEWDSGGEPTWEPLSALAHAQENLRMYESLHLNSKTLGTGTRIMVAATPLLLTNRHQIQFFQFQGSRLARSVNYFGIDEMTRLTTTSSDRNTWWLNSTILSWYSNSLRLQQQSQFVVFSPYAVIKFMHSTLEKLQGGFVDASYTDMKCRRWFIPISWQGDGIPRYIIV